MFFDPNAGSGDYKNSGNSSYGKYSVPSQDVSASDAVVTLENNAPSKALLEKFIKEIKYAPQGSFSGPKGMPMTSSMQAERMNPQHKAGFAAGDLLKENLKLAEMYVAQFLAIVGDKANAANFGKYLEGLEGDVGAQYVIQLINSWKESEIQLENMNNMVRYLDMERRQKYVIEPGTDGLLYFRDAFESAVKFERKPFDTSQSTAAYGGRSGRAIWVQGPSGRFYSSNESQAGKFHHSSFLAGRDVKAAGDWKVTGGKLMMISAISGHYHPTLDSLKGALVDLQAVSRQLVSWGGNVECYKKDNTPAVIPIRGFLDNCAKDPKYLEQFKPSD